MQNYQGDFIWYELMTDDADAAEGFYKSVIGWTSEMAGPGATEGYRLFKAAETYVAGLITLPEEARAAGHRPCWLGYIGVNDVDASAARAAADGATVLMAPATIDGVGRFALMRDPQGGRFYIMRGEMDAPSEAFAHDTPRDGHCAWNELATSDPESALTFYGAQFGWELAETLEMEPIGPYRMVRNPPRQSIMGAIMKAPVPEMPVLWSFYFRVPDIDVAAAKIAELGGTLMYPPLEIPGGEFTVQATDPQGASFALIGKRIAS